MTDAQRTLKQMILEGMYVVDEGSVAGAIVARARVRTAVARAGFRGDSPPAESERPAFGCYPQVNAFRRDPRSAFFGV